MSLSERRQRERERRRAAILTAAAAVFAERGVDGASMDAIAARAELGKATLYYYVRTKEELLAAIVAEGTERFFAELAVDGDDGGELADLVEAMLRGFVRFFRAHPDLLRVLVPYLAQMTLTPGPGHAPAHPAGAGGEVVDPATIPRHQAFVAALQRRLARSPWADRPQAFLGFLMDLFVALGQQVLADRDADLDARVAFYVDLIRGYRAGPPEGDATVARESTTR